MVDLVGCVRTLAAGGKGILAADESVHTLDERLKAHGIKSGPEMRHAFRELLLLTPGIEEFLSGVILFEETLSQKSNGKKLFPKMLFDRGIAPGIKVDEGTEPFPESPKEFITKGLIGLPERLATFKKAGATFTKWRAVIRIEGDHLPTSGALIENARRLASFALASQEVGLVPILEPEVLFEGTHSSLRARAVIEETLATVVAAVKDQAADPTALLIKTSMALSGSESGRTDTPEEVAEDTLVALMKAVPAEVPAIVFLSGGQTSEQAFDNLRAIAQRASAAGAGVWLALFFF